MIRVALAGLLGRKLRTALTALAIVLGVAMVSGTLVLTDSIDKAFNSIFTDVRQGSDAVITGKAAFDVRAARARSRRRSHQSLLAKVRAAARRAGGRGQRQRRGAADRPERQGDRLRRRAATSGSASTNGDSPFNPLTLVDGAWPSGGEVVIDKATATKKNLAVGDDDRRAGRGAGRAVPRSPGIVKFGSASTLGGATLAGFDLPTAQNALRQAGPARRDRGRGEARRVRRRARSREIQRCSRRPTQVRTGDRAGAGGRERRDAFISFLRGFLLAFGGIALFVGSVRDRELAVDHDRPAHARVRDDADARRDATAGARRRSWSRRS